MMKSNTNYNHVMLQKRNHKSNTNNNERINTSSIESSIRELGCHVARLEAQLVCVIDQVHDESSMQDSEYRRILDELNERLETNTEVLRNEISSLTNDTKLSFQRLGDCINDVVQNLVQHINERLAALGSMRDKNDTHLNIHNRLVVLEQEVDRIIEDFSELRGTGPIRRDNEELIRATQRQAKQNSALISEMQVEIQSLSKQVRSTLVLLERNMYSHNHPALAFSPSRR